MRRTTSQSRFPTPLPKPARKPSHPLTLDTPSHLARLFSAGRSRVQARDFKGAEEDFAEVENETAEDPLSRLRMHKKLAKVWLHACSVPRTLPHLRSMKSYADQTGRPNEKMKAYRDMGVCYQLVRKYETALVYFKKLLELAWVEDNMKMELCAYDNIGKQYYYMGLLSKAAYYSNRAWRGIVEPRDSPARILARNAYEARHKVHAAGQMRTISRNSSDLSGSELPSPISNSSTANLLSNLPHKSYTEHLPPLPKKALNVSAESEVAPFVLISHLSLNRSLKNYQCLKDSRKIKVRERHNKSQVL